MFQDGNLFDQWFILNRGYERRGELNIRIQMVGALIKGGQSDQHATQPVQDFATVPPAMAAGQYTSSKPPVAMPQQPYNQYDEYEEDPMPQERYAPPAAMPQQYVQAPMQHQPMMQQQPIMQQPPMMQQQPMMHQQQPVVQHQQPMMQQPTMQQQPVMYLQHPQMFPGQMVQPTYAPQYAHQAPVMMAAPPRPVMYQQQPLYYGGGEGYQQQGGNQQSGGVRAPGSGFGKIAAGAGVGALGGLLVGSAIGNRRRGGGGDDGGGDGGDYDGGGDDDWGDDDGGGGDY